jgi:hypothetical protein
MRLTLAVIGTFSGRHKNTFPLMHRLFGDGTRKPDEAWLMCETDQDATVIRDALAELQTLTGVTADPTIVVLPTPTAGGTYTEIPYSRKINHALDRTGADLIVYLDNGSMPSPYKYQHMAAALENDPTIGAVYCTQKRTGYVNETFHADKVVENGNGQLNYTQVMHRYTSDRWTTDMQYANPDLADAMFWTALHERLGAFHPAGGLFIHDDHHMPGPHAAGI